jgi:succinyl-CoA synthetase beta subunit
MRCDLIAEGVIAASRAVSVKVPLVVRMKSTNHDHGKAPLAQSGLPIITPTTRLTRRRSGKWQRKFDFHDAVPRTS